MIYSIDNPFKKIIDSKSNLIYEDEYVVAVNDINPKSNIHILVIPKAEVINLDHAHEIGLSMDNIFNSIAKIVSLNGLKNNYRIIINNGKNAGQEVFHLHFHLISNGTTKI